MADKLFETIDLSLLRELAQVTEYEPSYISVWIDAEGTHRMSISGQPLPPEVKRGETVDDTVRNAIKHYRREKAVSDAKSDIGDAWAEFCELPPGTKTDDVDAKLAALAEAVASLQAARKGGEK